MNNIDLESSTIGNQTAPTGARTETVTAITPTEVLPPSVAAVPNGFVETDYEPHPDVTPDEIAKLPYNDLLTGLKKQGRRTRREMEVYLLYYEEVVRRFDVEQARSDGGQFERKDKPLVKAFDAIGRHYETERKRAWRYRNALATRGPRPSASGQRKFHDWDFVKDDANSGEQIVVGKPKVGHVEIVSVGGNLEDAKVVPTSSLSRVPVTTIALNQLILCDDNGKRYRYAGNGLLKCAEVPKLVKQVQDRGAAAIKAQQEQKSREARAKAEEQERQNALNKAEAARHDLDLIAEKADKTKTKAELEAEKKKKAEAKAKLKAAQAQRPAKPEPTKTKADLEAEAKKAEEKAKQEAADKARQAEIAAATDASVAKEVRIGVQENGKPDFIGEWDADGAEVRQ